MLVWIGRQWNNVLMGLEASVGTAQFAGTKIEPAKSVQIPTGEPQVSSFSNISLEQRVDGSFCHPPRNLLNLAGPKLNLLNPSRYRRANPKFRHFQTYHWNNVLMGFEACVGTAQLQNFPSALGIPYKGKSVIEFALYAYTNKERNDKFDIKCPSLCRRHMNSLFY